MARTRAQEYAREFSPDALRQIETFARTFKRLLENAGDETNAETFRQLANGCAGILELQRESELSD